jgi:hypothetical protein
MDLASPITTQRSRQRRFTQFRSITMTSQSSPDNEDSSNFRATFNAYFCEMLAKTVLQEQMQS